ncbi:MAG TPA: phosphoglycolate phosphatase [Methylophaga sp.]|jgi:phosphoglycolate phosphatase|uniref:phosphoglycolate phosphatase n=1 Tax=unclassified Methylophaga TaxID=2629249 RepID=UPI000C97D401|nr:MULTISPECIES: phosphoglycolate phosphatase [unclassified Methylophaga]MAP27966.1 phosphoglycolate phosphatase [Methylophaga sp.]HAD31954.1 phosphoglycolate phosphatase [Methylophaga sp.]HCO01284.1 phosphoglycolate phosphatase [Methylophaga sp.]|tara:strand:+ start:3292 stop:3960 length:669 start_codon:yes stop_codon:yes gene_type:complete
MGLIKPELALIDLDGTLVDSVPDLAWCTDQTMRALNLPERGEAKVRNWVGNGVERLIKRALINQLDGEPAEALYAQAVPIFMALYAENTSKRSLLYPGVKQGLQWLKDQGIHLGCVTNKDEQFTLPILNNLGIRDYFELIVSGDTLPQKKPDPAPLLYAANYFKIEPQQALMIGDSVSDVKASRAAGFQIVCMSYGYNHGNDIRAAHPDAVIDSFAELNTLF